MRSSLKPIFTSREHQERQGDVCRLKDLMRECHTAHFSDRAGRITRLNAVISDRATYKTTALIQFVGERMLILAPPARVGVVCPNIEIAKRFAIQYQEVFPDGPAGIRNPLVASIDEVSHGCWNGWEVSEVYAEEMFMMRPREIHAIPNFICGIGTLHRPVTIRVENW